MSPSNYAITLRARSTRMHRAAITQPSRSHHASTTHPPRSHSSSPTSPHHHKSTTNKHINKLITIQLFYSFFKTLVGKEITVELKNDLAITGILHSVDQYLNIKLKDISISDSEKYPYMVCLVERGRMGEEGNRREGEEKEGMEETLYSCLLFFLFFLFFQIDFSKELFYQRIRGEVRANTTI